MLLVPHASAPMIIVQEVMVRLPKKFIAANKRDKPPISRVAKLKSQKILENRIKTQKFIFEFCYSTYFHHSINEIIYVNCYKDISYTPTFFACSILKFMQKGNAKKGRKFMFKFNNHAKMTKMHFQFQNSKARYLGFFLLLYPPTLFFLIFKLKIHIKKDKNAKKG